MRALIRYLTLAFTILLSFSINYIAIAEPADLSKPKGIILLIGDGMGVNQVKATEIYAKNVLNKELAISSIKTTGLTTTHSASSSVTDSAAAATAIYTGYKAKNGQLNVLPDGTHAEGIGWAAKKAGLAVGIVSTARITDATPAALYATSERRDSHNEIAEQLPIFMADVVLGVGWRHFVPSSQKHSDRRDETDIIAVMKNKGYEYVTNVTELEAVKSDKVKRLFGLFSVSNMPYTLDRKDDPVISGQPSLAEMTRVAISMVAKNPKGFLLVVEGGRIDHACHANDIKTTIYETLDFDDAVSVAIKYRENHPDVLVIVTADHETGGLKQIGDADFSMDPKSLQPIRKSLAHIENKIKNHPDQQDSLLKASGLELTDNEADLLKAFQAKAEEQKLAGKNEQEKSNKYKSSALLSALTMITSQRANVDWTTNGHTGQPIITRAVGPGAELFSGNYDNTDIAVRIAKLLNLSIPKLNEILDKQSGLGPFFWIGARPFNRLKACPSICLME